MARIIGGNLGSLRLKTAAKATRPTSDRVKESLFAILESRGLIEGAVVIDLFAGSGALGLEAASRGAKSVTFVDRDSAAQMVIQANIESAEKGLANQGRTCRLILKKQSAETVNPGGFDLMFVDPPYDFDDEKLVKLLLPWIDTRTTIAIERSKSSRIETLLNLKNSDVRSYGETKLIIAYSDLSATPV